MEAVRLLMIFFSCITLRLRNHGIMANSLLWVVQDVYRQPKGCTGVLGELLQTRVLKTESPANTPTAPVEGITSQLRLSSVSGSLLDALDCGCRREGPRFWGSGFSLTPMRKKRRILAASHGKLAARDVGHIGDYLSLLQT